MIELNYKKVRALFQELKNKGYKNLVIHKVWEYTYEKGFCYNYAIGQYFKDINYFKRFDINEVKK